ncbi:MAG TPA: hypothetical protein VLT33_26890 [Labilithrix sp.]|nr:hypothetical protein [Labilithrix sp.]
MKRAAALAIGLTLTSLAPLVSADEGERVMLVTHAPARCLTTEVLVRQIRALGAALRPANEDEPARRIEITIAKEAWGYDVLLALRDRAGQVTERRVKASDCAAAARAASLLVVLALDAAPPGPAPEEPEEPPPAPPPGEPGAAFWPAPVADDGGTTGMTVRRVKVSRLGSGGLLLSGTYGFSSDLQEDASARLVGVARVVSTTRIGLGLGVDHELRDVRRDGLRYDMAGWSGRASGVIAWGAPWDDFPIGFLGEVGVAAGEQHGTAYQRRALPDSWYFPCGGECLIDGRGRPTSATFVSPFFSWAMLFQLPFKWSPVRPVAGLTGSWTPLEPHGSVTTFGATLGMAWQAW